MGIAHHVSPSRVYVGARCTGKVPKPRPVLRALGLSDAFHEVVNTAIAAVVGRTDADDGTPALALPKAVHTRLVLRCLKVVNQFLHDKSKAQAEKIAAAALELALLLRKEADEAARDSNRSTIAHDAPGYLELMLTGTGLGPASATSCLPERVRRVLGARLLTRIGSRTGGRTAAEISAVRAGVATKCAFAL